MTDLAIMLGNPFANARDWEASKAELDELQKALLRTAHSDMAPPLLGRAQAISLVRLDSRAKLGRKFAVRGDERLVLYLMSSPQSGMRTQPGCQSLLGRTLLRLALFGSFAHESSTQPAWIAAW